MKPRTIQVKGKGTVSHPPDRLQIIFTISETQEEFTETIETCNQRTSAVRQAISGVGIRESELKTTSFNVREAYEYDDDRKHVQSGFEATHKTSLELPIDKPLIGKLLSAVLRGEGRPGVNLIFTVSDPEGLKQKVLADAVANATKRAETIVQAASLKLGAIEHIEYGYAEIRVSSRVFGLTVEATGFSSNNISPDMEPEDIEAEDSVTITWALT